MTSGPLLTLLALACFQPLQAASVVRVEAKGAIMPPLSRHIREGISWAAGQRASAVLIELDTPGGLLDSTREIVSEMLNAELPVIVYVSPAGGRATSAGVFIVMAADVAAMAPGTHLGAAHPVALGGGSKDNKEKSAVNLKAVSDAAAYVRALAAEKGRNADWAEKAVRESASLPAEEAVRRKVVEVLAADRPELLKRLEGRRVVKKGGAVRLKLAGAEVLEFPMPPARRFLQVISNPNVALLLLMLGVYGLIYEFASPGVGFGAVVGLTCLLLAGYALSVLPVNYAGLGLIVLGLTLLVVELQVPSYGLLSIGGLGLLALGSLFLFESGPTFLRVSLEAVAGVTAATGAFFMLVIAKLLKFRRLSPAVGVEALIGRIGEARETLAPRGLVFVNSELWTAEAPLKVEKGARVRVIEVVGSELRVKPLEEDRHE